MFQTCSNIPFIRRLSCVADPNSMAFYCYYSCVYLDFRLVGRWVVILLLGRLLARGWPIHTPYEWTMIWTYSTIFLLSLLFESAFLFFSGGKRNWIANERIVVEAKQSRWCKWSGDITLRVDSGWLIFAFVDWAAIDGCAGIGLIWGVVGIKWMGLEGLGKDTIMNEIESFS